MKTRPYRGKMIPVKKGGASLQLCAQERSLLKDLIERKINILIERKDFEGNQLNKIEQRDLTYYKKIYSKLTKKKVCPECGKWI